MSKWLVGSSNTSRATGFNKNCANATRAYEMQQNKGHEGTMILMKFVASRISVLPKGKKDIPFGIRSMKCRALSTSFYIPIGICHVAFSPPLRLETGCSFVTPSRRKRSKTASIPPARSMSPGEPQFAKVRINANHLDTPAATLTTLRG